MTAAEPAEPLAVVERLRSELPWLLDPRLDTCVVGSLALAEACRRSGAVGPRAEDVDLAWTLDVEAGERALREHGVLCPTTAGSRARGTLALRAAGRRIEITTFRGDEPGSPARIESDLAHRDMTIGAIAWRLADGALFDPFDGLGAWRERRIEAVGEPADRVAEHPLRWLSWFRRAHELGFALSPRIRKLGFDAPRFASVPPEAVAAELRRALDRLASPGRLLVELHEQQALRHIAPELAPQFDGRPAGPIRHHPEISQALHLVLALEWAAARSRELSEQDRNAVMVAVLCHDLGKGLTPRSAMPSHHGHEDAGVPLVGRLLDRLPGLTDPRGRKLAEQVCRLHLSVRGLRAMRRGTLATLYERELRGAAFPLELFALAIGADAGGRLGRAAEGDAVRERIRADLRRLREAADAVDAAELRERFGSDLEAFRRALHARRARAIGAAFADGRGAEPPA